MTRIAAGNRSSVPALQNLFTYSNTPSNAAWTKEGITAPADATVPDPFGGAAASALTEDGNNAVHRMSQLAYTAAEVGKTVTVSGCFKAGTQTVICSNVAGLAEVDFNLSTGTLTKVGTVQYAEIISYGDGWYRCSATFTVLATHVGFRNFWSVKQVSAYQGNNGDKAIYSYELQKAYANWAGGIGHTDAVALNTGNIRNRATLRQNYLTYSEQFDNGAWATLGVTTVTANQAVNPYDGAQTADLIDFSGGVAGDGKYQSVVVPTGLKAITVSAWVRTVSGSGNVDFGILNYANPSAAVTTSWQRLTYTATIANTAIGITLRKSAASAASQIYVFGAQLVVAGRAGEYQPTTTAAVNDGNIRSSATRIAA